jgi:hypothetical protein
VASPGSDDPSLYLPLWQRLSSGLWAPGSLSADAIRVEPLPAEVRELLPHPRAVLGPGRAASSLDQIVVKPTEADLGLDPLPLDEYPTLASTLPFEPAMVAICRLSAMLWHTRTDPAAQLSVARVFFNEAPILARFEAFLRAESHRVLFSEQQLFLVQRLLIEHAGPGALGAPLVPGHIEGLCRLLVAAGTVADEGSPAIARGDANATEILAFMIRDGAFYARPNLLSLYARSYALFIEGARHHAAEPDAVPLDDWIAEAYPLTLDEQYAVGFALYAASNAANPDVKPDERSLITLATLSSTAMRDRSDEIMAVLAASRSEFAHAFGRDTLTVTPWDVTPFMQRPFVALENGELALISPRALMTWLGDGPYYRLLDIASAKTTRRANHLERYTSFVGKLLENWALGLVQSAHPEPRPPGSGKVWGEQPYGRGAGKRTPDVFIDIGEDVVVIEVRSGYLNRQARVGTNPDDVIRDLNRLVFRKVNQLGERIQDILRGTAQVPDVDPAHIRRVWPILVTANLTQPEGLHDLVNQQLPASMRDPRIQKVVLMDPEDLEVLMALVEEGHSIVEILSRRQETSYVRLEFLRWIIEAPGLGAPRAHSTYARERWDRFSHAMVALLEIDDPGSQD